VLAGELEVGLCPAGGAAEGEPGSAAQRAARFVEEHRQVVGAPAARAAEAAEVREAHVRGIGRARSGSEGRGILSPMNVSVLLFGSLREAAGAKELAVSLPEGSSVAALTALLARDHAAFARLPGRVRVSVNYEVVEETRALRDGDEVAYLPPVSGGGGRCRISERSLEPEAVAALVAGPDCGGLVSFSGAVRDHSRGRSIRHLEYEAYPGMAEAEMERICSEAAERWPGARVAIAHRVGRLAIGELAVVVCAAAPHRDAAFSAARYAIDVLKERVPIWKKEVATDGEYWVEEHA